MGVSEIRFTVQRVDSQFGVLHRFSISASSLVFLGLPIFNSRRIVIDFLESVMLNLNLSGTEARRRTLTTVYATWIVHGERGMTLIRFCGMRSFARPHIARVCASSRLRSPFGPRKPTPNVGVFKSSMLSPLGFEKAITLKCRETVHAAVDTNDGVISQKMAPHFAVPRSLHV